MVSSGLIVVLLGRAERRGSGRQAGACCRSLGTCGAEAPWLGSCWVSRSSFLSGRSSPAPRHSQLSGGLQVGLQWLGVRRAGGMPKTRPSFSSPAPCSQSCGRLWAAVRARSGRPEFGVAVAPAWGSKRRQHIVLHALSLADGDGSYSGKAAWNGEAPWPFQANLPEHSATRVCKARGMQDESTTRTTQGAPVTPSFLGSRRASLWAFRGGASCSSEKATDPRK